MIMKMKPFPYSRFDRSSLILRDELAIARTLLANERTLLAYLRSSVAMVIAGVTIIHFAQANWFQIVGFVCIPIGIITALVGMTRYQRMHEAIALVQEKWEKVTQPPPAPDAE